jgi:putative NADH-flavin reductase
MRNTPSGGPTRLVILGASGSTGRLLVDQALERGYAVTAVSRSDPFGPGRDGLKVKRVDVRDRQALRAALIGHDAALSVIGGTPKQHGRIYSEGTAAIVEALEAAGVHRFVCTSSGGVNPADRGLPLWYRLAIPLFLDDLYKDMRVMESTVRASGLDWTIVRPAYLTDAPARGKYRVEDGRNPKGGWRIARADLAAFLLDQVDGEDWHKALPTIAY